MQTPSPGKMKSSLRFERQGAVTNVGGVVSGGWSSPTLIATTQAFVEPRKGAEGVIAGRMAGNAQYNIWIHSSEATRTLTNADRAVNTRTGEIYNLGIPIDPDNKRQWLLIDAVSDGNANGEG